MQPEPSSRRLLGPLSVSALRMLVFVVLVVGGVSVSAASPLLVGVPVPLVMLLLRRSGGWNEQQTRSVRRPAKAGADQTTKDARSTVNNTALPSLKVPAGPWRAQSVVATPLLM